MKLDDLPRIGGARYPGMDATYDLSPCLVNGFEAFLPGRVTATVEANRIFWEMWIRADAAVGAPDSFFLRDLPSELMPPVQVPRLAFYRGAPAQILIRPQENGFRFNREDHRIEPGTLVVETWTRRGA